MAFWKNKFSKNLKFKILGWRFFWNFSYIWKKKIKNIITWSIFAWKFLFTYRWNPLEKLRNIGKNSLHILQEQKIHRRKRVFDKICHNCFSLHFFFLSYLKIICIYHMILVIMIFIAKYMNNFYFTKYFLKIDIFEFKWSI